MTKVVYSACYGGFGLSEEACALYRSKTGAGSMPNRYELSRHDPALVEVVEELGEKANTRYSDLKIAEVNGPYRIDEYDGFESVETPDSYDWIDP